MNIASLSQYLLVFLLHFAPVSAHNFTGATEASTLGRYRDIARDIAEAALDHPLFAGSQGVLETALLDASVATFESGGLREDVDTCKTGGDGRRSWSLFQLQEPWTPKVVACASRLSAAKTSLDIIQTSLKQCKDLPQSERLAMYAAGQCHVSEKFTEEQLAVAKSLSRNRWNRAERWLRSHPFNEN
jgi:hypothetical protein